MNDRPLHFDFTCFCVFTNITQYRDSTRSRKKKTASTQHGDLGDLQEGRCEGTHLLLLESTAIDMGSLRGFDETKFRRIITDCGVLHSSGDQRVSKQGFFSFCFWSCVCVGYRSLVLAWLGGIRQLSYSGPPGRRVGEQSFVLFHSPLPVDFSLH